jgi:hypothetical protein
LVDWEDRVREQMHDRVWVDFNSGFDRREPDGRHFRQPSLETTGSKRGLDRLGIELTENTLFTVAQSRAIAVDDEVRCG